MKIRVSRVAGALFASALIFAGGYVARYEVSPAGPRACHIGRDVLPSGDAGTGDGRTYVCTDGTMVTVTGYGGK